jgi:hypothetical protein
MERSEDQQSSRWFRASRALNESDPEPEPVPEPEPEPELEPEFHYFTALPFDVREKIYKLVLFTQKKREGQQFSRKVSRTKCGSYFGERRQETGWTGFMVGPDNHSTDVACGLKARHRPSTQQKNEGWSERDGEGKEDTGKVVRRY